MSSLEEVKVGDQLFVSDGLIDYIETVERLTQLYVVTKKHRFNKKDGTQCSSKCWDTLYARPVTDEDIKQQKHRELAKRCNAINFSHLSDSQLEQILEIANKKEL